MGNAIRIGFVVVLACLVWQCSDKPTAQPATQNHHPFLSPIASQTVQEGVRLEFVVQATDPDGTVPTLSATNLPTNASAVDSGNGKLLFVFEPDFTQLGTCSVTFIATDSQLADSLMVTITVTPYRVRELWPMAVGNYWVYETKRGSPSEWTLDSIHVQSSYQSDGVTHWRLNHFLFPYMRTDIAIRNDSIIMYLHNVASPSLWPDRADTVPAGIFKLTHEDCRTPYGLERECLVFAKGVGVIKYRWFNGSPHYPDSYEARLIRYKME